MKIITTLICSLAVALSTLSAQNTNVRIGEAINGMDPNEPSVYVNPVISGEIMVGTNPDLWYRSADGGLTWQRGRLTSPYGVNCDPVIVADDRGSYYYFHLVPNLSRVVCQKKEDTSADWAYSSYTALNGTMHIDKEWAAFDPVRGNMYVTWTQFNRHGSLDPGDSTIIFLSRSEDRGVTWSEKIRISNRGGNASGGFQSVHGSYPATGPNGEVYVCWWSPQGLMFDKSTDGGRTWLTSDIRVTGPVQWIYPMPGMQLNPSFPVISCDRSTGRYRGAIYINWADGRNGNQDSDIWVVKSMDGGRSWSAPIRVNDDPPGKQQFFNFLAVDQVTGTVYIAYYDRRDYTDNQTDVYAAISRDGCSTFENRKISQTPFTPLSTAFIGHYLGISAHNDLVFAVWTRQDGGINSLWGARLETGSSGIDDALRGPVTLEPVSPNPFTEYTVISFRTDKDSPVTLSIHDVNGRELTRILDRSPMQPGKHNYRFNPGWYGLDSGVYHYRLMAGNNIATGKMVYIR